MPLQKQASTAIRRNRGTSSGVSRHGNELALAGVIALTTLACRTLPPQPVVNEVQIDGLQTVDDEPLLEGLSTAETPLLFGVIPGVLEYTTYDQNVLARDLERIERYLHARGRYEAKVWAARVVSLGDHRVRVEIRVHEGPAVRVSRIDPGVSRLPFDLMLVVNRARRMADGDVFDEAVFEADKERIGTVLAESGYAFAKVEAKARVDVAARSAHVVYTIEPGQKARYGPIRFVGLDQIPERPVRNQLNLREGDDYNSSELAEAEQALVSLGVFANVEIRPDRSHPETGVVPIQVRVRESSLHGLRLGGGARFDVLRLSGHLMTGWEHRNFLGGIRHFRVEARPGLTLFPTRIDRIEPWTAYLPEYRSQVSLRQPSFVEARTTGILRAEYNVYPLLYPLPEDVEPDNERIIGYQEIRASAGVERSFFNYRLLIAPSYNWQANFPFTYQGDRTQRPRLGASLLSRADHHARPARRSDPDAARCVPVELAASGGLCLRWHGVGRAGASGAPHSICRSSAPCWQRASISVFCSRATTARPWSRAAPKGARPNSIPKIGP